LAADELKSFKAKKISPRITPFATDAVAFIKNKTANDTLIALQDVVDFVHGKSVPNIKGLVFDNANSSTARYISEIAGMAVANQKNIFSFKTNEEVIKYVAENSGMIGVIGMNWIFQPPLDLQEVVDKVNVMGVKGKNSNEYVFPTQDNLAQGKYPLARRLYIINCQGYTGLGMGFASFLGASFDIHILCFCCCPSVWETCLQREQLQHAGAHSICQGWPAACLGPNWHSSQQ
jgi:phosphate transport system substrate-binding protein